jgi:hypothetical protein
LKKEGFDAEFKLLDAGHELSDKFVSASKGWLKALDYAE